MVTMLTVFNVEQPLGKDEYLVPSLVQFKWVAIEGSAYYNSSTTDQLVFAMTQSTY